MKLLLIYKPENDWNKYASTHTKHVCFIAVTEQSGAVNDSTNF